MTNEFKVVPFFAADQPLVNLLCSIIYKFEYDEELTEKEMELFERIVDQ